MEDGDGLFNIEISSLDKSTNTPKVARGHQSEVEFQNQRREWRPKIESGELWKSLDLPINNPSKPESQTILHAVEELYFFRRYEGAAKLVGMALEGELQDDFRKMLEDYQRRCHAKLTTVK